MKLSKDTLFGQKNGTTEKRTSWKRTSRKLLYLLGIVTGSSLRRVTVRPQTHVLNICEGYAIQSRERVCLFPLLSLEPLLISHESNMTDKMASDDHAF